MAKQNLRIQLYRKIEVGRKQIPFLRDDDNFRNMLWDKFGVESRKSMDIIQLKRLVFHLQELGAVFTTPAKKQTEKSNYEWVEITDSMFMPKEKRQILAIWRKLGYTLNALNTRCNRTFNVPVFTWLKDADQIRTLLNDLQRREKAFERRHGEK